MKRMAFAAVLAVPVLAFAAGEVPALKSVFGSKFLVGAAIEPSQLRIPTDAALLKQHFSSITAENVMKPRTLGPAPGEYDFAPADELVRFAQANGLELRGHTLLWHRSAPDWFFAGDRSNESAYRAEVRKRLERYITDAVRRCGCAEGSRARDRRSRLCDSVIGQQPVALALPLSRCAKVAPFARRTENGGRPVFGVNDSRRRLFPIDQATPNGDRRI